MHLVLKTKIQKVAAATILLVVITIFLFIFGYYGLGIAGLTIICILATIFIRLLPEELIIYFLKMNSGRMTRKDIISKLSPKVEKVIKRMSDNGLIEVECDYVILSDLSELSAFEERNR